MAQSYEQSGVSLEAGYESVRRIKKHIAKTERLGMMGNIGSFGGMFDLSLLAMREPVLVSGTDGVGTKLKLAFWLNKHDTIGQDVVAMCVNDVLAQGAQPLFFLDYIAVGKNNPAQIEQIVKGVADGCVMANCALIGGETAEMPDMYQNGEYDIAGFTVGVVEKSKLIDGSKVNIGDILIGIKSSGVHSNGFSLVRKIVMKDHNFDLYQHFDELQGKLGEVLLTPTKIYVKPVLEVLQSIDVHAICHITGGGFDENIPRVLKENQSVEIIENSWEKSPIFNFLEKWGNIPHREMFNIFNMGIGMILVVKSEDATATMKVLNDCGETSFEIGKIVEKCNFDVVIR
jgi:phosphoribosylformylglycinamidine cyclo-ligase